MHKQLLLLLGLVVLTISFCKQTGCTQCRTYLLNGVFVQSCQLCGTGYKLNLTTNKCDFDIGLVIGVGLAAVIILIVQITCFCICRAFFEQQHKRKIQFTLDQIFQQLEAERNDVEINRQLRNLYQKFHDEESVCVYCQKYPQEKPDFRKLQKKIQETERKLQQRKQQSNSDEFASGEESESEISQIPPHPYGPTIKVKCQHQHLYHIQCLKKHLLSCPEGEKECICNGHDIAPFYMICVECKLKHRLLKLELTDKNIEQIQDYICSICYRRRKSKQQKTKWWKKLF